MYHNKRIVKQANKLILNKLQNKAKINKILMQIKKTKSI